MLLVPYSSTIDVMLERNPVKMDATPTTVITPTTIPSTVRKLRNLLDRMASSAIRTVSVGNADFALIVSFSSGPRWDQAAPPSSRDRYRRSFRSRRTQQVPEERSPE